jgi:hypothetical protein
MKPEVVPGIQPEAIALAQILGRRPGEPVLSGKGKRIL